jgi:hypothetical protein
MDAEKIDFEKVNDDNIIKNNAIKFWHYLAYYLSLIIILFPILPIVISIIAYKKLSEEEKPIIIVLLIINIIIGLIYAYWFCDGEDNIYRFLMFNYAGLKLALSFIIFILTLIKIFIITVINFFSSL